MKSIFDGGIWLVKRSEKGLLAAMTEVPTTNWFDKKAGETFEPSTALDHAPQAPRDANGLEWRKKTGQVSHTFTYFQLFLDVYEASWQGAGTPTTTSADTSTSDGWWSTPDQIPTEALPTIFRKVVEMD